jgi:hypothetical protein
MRGLSIRSENDGDDNATEMARVWIGNGFKQSHDWNDIETMAQLRKHFNKAIKQRAPGLEGYFPNGH